jgi:F0F1-type ATP synthase delta subunit
MIESLKNGFLRVLIMNSYSEFIEQIFISMFDLIEKHNNICNKIQRITSY